MAFSGGSLLASCSIALLAVAVWFNASNFSPKEFRLPPPPPLTGPLALNKPKVLEKLFEGQQLIGPESLVVEKNVIYTCNADGRCVKIVDGKVQKTVHMSPHKNCDVSRSTTPYCGRPLGIRRYNANQFIVIDAVLGLFAIDFEKGTKELLFSSSRVLDGKRFLFPDDFDFVDNDTVVFSDASTGYSYHDFPLSFLENSQDGRLVEFKLSTGQMRVLADGLSFANGVQVHPDKQSVVFCESAAARVQRYYFAGPKRGRQELFAENLPGFPDNIRTSASGKSFYLALFGHRSEHSPHLVADTMGARTLLRKLLCELTRVLPDWAMHTLLLHSTSYGIVLELDLDGRIVRSLHDPTGGVINCISQVNDDGGDYLYLGSFAMPYIGRISKN